MPVWKTLPVTDEPQIALERWTIYELPSGDRHFAGYYAAGWEGRVSSRIVSFDPTARRGVTRSGRVYQLLGESGVHPDSEYVWDAWCRINSVDSSTAHAVDVTQES